MPLKKASVAGGIDRDDHIAEENRLMAQKPLTYSRFGVLCGVIDSWLNNSVPRPVAASALTVGTDVRA